MELNSIERELLSHSGLNLEKLASCNILGDKPTDREVGILKDCIAILKIAIEECISDTSRRPREEDDVVIVVNQQFSTMPIMATILATYFNKWKVYALISKHSLSIDSKSYKKPENLHLIDLTEAKEFIEKNGGIYIPYNILYFMTSTTLETEYLKDIRQPKGYTCDVFFPTMTSTSSYSNLNINNISNYGDVFEINSGNNTVNAREFLTIYSDIMLRKP
jgi:hypothetical protein